MANEECSICAGTYEGEAMVTLECTHRFHVDCVVQWFRYHNTSCPNCRSDTCHERWTRRTPLQRIAALRKRRNLPAPTRTLIRKLDECRTTQRAARAELRALRVQHRAVFQTVSKLNTRIFACARRERHLVRTIDTHSHSTPRLVYAGPVGDEDTAEDSVDVSDSGEEEDSVDVSDSGEEEDSVDDSDSVENSDSVDFGG